MSRFLEFVKSIGGENWPPKIQFFQKDFVLLFIYFHSEDWTYGYCYVAFLLLK